MIVCFILYIQSRNKWQSCYILWIILLSVSIIYETFFSRLSMFYKFRCLRTKERDIKFHKDSVTKFIDGESEQKLLMKKRRRDGKKYQFICKRPPAAQRTFLFALCWNNLTRCFLSFLRVSLVALSLFLRLFTDLRNGRLIK